MKQTEVAIDNHSCKRCGEQAVGGELNASEYITSPSYSYGSRNTAKMGWKDSKKKKKGPRQCVMK